MANKTENVWKNIESNWISFSNQNDFSESILNKGDEIEQLKTKIKLPNQFYLSDRKQDNPSKGTLCYTTQGFGVIQEIKQEQQIYVIKLKNTEQIKEFKKKEVKFELILQLNVINNNTITFDSIVVPLTSSINQLENIINKSLNSEKGEFQSILYQGKELKKLTQFELMTLGINEHSKFIAINPQVQSDGWCYSNGSKDGFSFTVSKDLRFGGIGMYTTKEEAEFQVQLIEGKSNTDAVLAEKNFILNKTDGKTLKCLFDKSVLLKAEVQYTIIQTCLKNAKFQQQFNLNDQFSGFYGQGGEKQVTTENGIIFNFDNCTGASNGTDYSRGQIPEIYYYA